MHVGRLVKAMDNERNLESHLLLKSTPQTILYQKKPGDDIRPILPNSLATQFRIKDRSNQTMDTPKAHKLADFLGTNEDLPDVLQQEVHEILAEHRQHLTDLDEEIKYHEERIEQLKIQRSQVQEDIAQYDVVCSPIRRAHADILRNIFFHCLPTIRNPIMNAKEAPLLLTRVCRKWRQIAYSSPTLWSQVHITFTDDDLAPDIEDEAEKQSILNTLRLRCTAVEQWLLRSGECPLSISICYTTCLWMEYGDPRPPLSDITSQLFCILLYFSSRWKNIELYMPMETFAHLGRIIPGEKLPMLDSFMASFRCQTFDEEDYSKDVSQVLRLTDVTKLSLSVQGQDFRESNWSLNHILSPDLNLTNLRNLSNHIKANVLETSLLLRGCPNLEYFTALIISNEDDHDHEALATIFCQGPIYLPYLRFLCIEDIIKPTVKHNLYEHIEAPRLEWIDYTKYNGDHTRRYDLGTDNPMTIDPAPIATLLQRSPVLRKLILQVNDLQTSQVRRIIHYASSVKHLVLGPEQSRTTKEPMAPSWYTGRSSVPKWKFGRLFFDNYPGNDKSARAKGAANIPAPTPCFVLPNLEILEISKNVSTNIEDETLLAFILSRMDPSSLTKMLQKLTVDFNRTMDLDVAKDVYAHADRIGVNIELKLDYVQPVQVEKSKTRNPLDPDRGVGPDGRSWELRDIENEVEG